MPLNSKDTMMYLMSARIDTNITASTLLMTESHVFCVFLRLFLLVDCTNASVTKEYMLTIESTTAVSRGVRQLHERQHTIHAIVVWTRKHGASTSTILTFLRVTDSPADRFCFIRAFSFHQSVSVSPRRFRYPRRFRFCVIRTPAFQNSAIAI